LHALISNVIRYAAAGEYICAETGRSNQETFVSVSYKGPGISKEHKMRFFERWWRGDASRGRAGGGSGLGLPVVEAIVERHGGGVSVSNASSDQGAVFEITLPQTP